MPIKYIDNQLHFCQNNQEHNLVDLAQKINEPFYLYDIDGVIERYNTFKKAIQPAHLHFALKSNNYEPLIRALIKNGSGLDVVSGGELKYGLELGVDAKKIVFSGVGKTKEEIELAVKSEIFQLNVESLEELERIGQISKSLKKTTSVAFRLNPNIHLDTHKFIQTGTSDNKFGMEEENLPAFIDIINKYNPYLKFQGLAVHIGSGGLSFDPIIQSIAKMRSIYESLNRQGQNLTTIDIGGGLGIDYKDENLQSDLDLLAAFSSDLKKALKDFDGHVLAEPGRFIVARFGWLLAEIQYIKKTSLSNFAILNTGMHHLIRPVLYQAYHQVKQLKKSDAKKEKYTLGGPICESSDILARDREFSKLTSGDWLVFYDVGAYGSVMSLQYNMFHPIKEISFSQGAIQFSS